MLEIRREHTKEIRKAIKFLEEELDKAYGQDCLSDKLWDRVSEDIRDIYNALYLYEADRE